MATKSTIDDHVQTGIQLTLIKNNIIKSLTFIAQKNGKTKVKSQLCKLENAYKLIDSVRSDLEKLMLEENINREELNNSVKKYGYVNGFNDIYYCNQYLQLKSKNTKENHITNVDEIWDENDNIL